MGRGREGGAEGFSLIYPTREDKTSYLEWESGDKEEEGLSIWYSKSVILQKKQCLKDNLDHKATTIYLKLTYCSVLHFDKKPISGTM